MDLAEDAATLKAKMTLQNSGSFIGTCGLFFSQLEVYEGAF